MTSYTKEQIQVIKTADERVEVLACAGSGKSSTLVARIGWLVEHGMNPDQILVLSFSNIAVNVLNLRLKDQRIHIQTFHAFAQSLMLQHYRELGFGTPPTLIASADQLSLVRRAVKASRGDRIAIRRKNGINLSTDKELYQLGTFYSCVQGDGKLAKNLVSDPNSEFYEYRGVLKQLRHIHDRYLKCKRQAGVVDYADMLLYGRRVLQANVGLPYRHLFVDECQDMSQGQAELLRVLATQIPHVMTFGDPQQAVFGFMGGRFRQLSSLMGNVKTYQLTKSFRLTQSTAALVAAIGAPLADRPLHIRGRETGKKPVLIRCKTTYGQTQSVMSTVRQITRDSAVTLSIAVLARTRAQLRAIEVTLLAAGYHAQPLNRDPASAHMDAVLRVLALAGQIAIRASKRERLDASELEQELLAAANLLDAQITPRVIAASRRKLLEMLLSPTLQGRYIGARKVYEKLLRAAGRITAGIRAEIGRWEPLCNQFQCSAEFEEFVRQVTNRPAVTLSTIHGAKGGEWDHVLVIGISDGSLPFYREIARGAVDEERRLLFVAASRPRQRLYLFQAPFHHVSSDLPYDKPSRFLTSAVRKQLMIANERSVPCKK